MADTTTARENYRRTMAQSMPAPWLEDLTVARDHLIGTRAEVLQYDGDDEDFLTEEGLAEGFIIGFDGDSGFPVIAYDGHTADVADPYQVRLRFDLQAMGDDELHAAIAAAPACFGL